MKKPYIILHANEFHWGNDIPFMECENETENNGEQNEYRNEDDVWRNKNIWHPFTEAETFV